MSRARSNSPPSGIVAMSTVYCLGLSLIDGSNLLQKYFVFASAKHARVNCAVTHELWRIMSILFFTEASLKVNTDFNL